MAFKGITAFVLGNNGEGGGGGGTTNYNDLTNHPQINGNELTGNKTADQLGLLPSDTDIPTKLSDLDEDATHRTVTDLEKQSWNNKVDSVAGKGLSTNDYTDEDKTALTNKVDKVTGKGLSTNDYTDGEKEDVAQVDGLVSSVGGLTSRVGIAEGKVRTLEGEMLSVQDALDTKVDKETGKGLSTNDYSNADKAIVDGVTTALAGKVDTSSIGTANGVAGLDNTGRVPSSQLPSYVDDVLEYASLSAFPATGEGGKIYIALDTNKTYRWSGSAYVEISESLALGETQGTAYEGNKGKANADAIAVLETTVGAIPEQIETVVKDTVGFVGKNKLKITYSGDTYTHNGITFTLNRNSNGEVTSIVANGTNDGTRNSEFIFARPQFPNGTYIFSGGISENKRMYYYSGSQWYDTKGEPVEFTVNDDSNTAVAIVIVKNSICNNDTFYPMIYDANIIDAEFEPYHETVQEMFDSLGTASTKNAISVVTESSDLVESGAVKDIVGWGNKNKLPYFTETKTGSGTLSVIPSNGRYSFTGTAGGASAIQYPVTVPINSGVYRFVADGYEHVEGSNISLYYNDNGTIKALASDETIDLSIYAITAIAFFAGANNSVNYLNIGLMLVKESESDKSFEPYHESVEKHIPQVVSDAIGWDCGKLAPLMRDTTDINNGITYTPRIESNKVNAINVNGTATGTSYYVYASGNGNFSLNDGYTKSLIPSGSTIKLSSIPAGVTVHFRYTDGTYDLVLQEKQIRLTKDVGLVYLQVIVGITIDNIDVSPTIIHLTVDEQKADNSVIGTVEGVNASKAWSVGEHFIKDGAFKEVTQPIASGGEINSSNTVDKPIAELLDVVWDNAVSSSEMVILADSFKKCYKYGKVVNGRIRFELTNTISGSMGLFVLPYIPILDNPIITVYNRNAPYNPISDFAAYINNTGTVVVNGNIPAGEYEFVPFYICK